MRWLPPNDGSSSNGGEYAESDVDHGAASDADPKDGETCVDENGVPGEDVEDRAWPVTEKIPREHYIEQLETFDEAEYTQEDYEDRSTRLLDCVEALWNEYVTAPMLARLVYVKLS